MYQRKSNQSNNSFRRQNNQQEQQPQQSSFHLPGQSQPRFILKNPSYFPLRPQSVLEVPDDLPVNHSYLEIYKQQKRQQPESPDLIYHNPRNSQNSITDSDPQQVSLKLQQILQKQIVNKPNKSKTHHTTNSSFEMQNYHKIGKSVDEIKYQQPTATKPSQQTKLSYIGNDVPTPTPIINQITFSGDQTQGQEELVILRAENKKLISSIKKLNLDFQQQKAQNQTLQTQNNKLKQELDEQASEFNRMIDLLNQEKADMQSQIISLQQKLGDFQRSQDMIRQRSCENSRPAVLTKMHDFGHDKSQIKELDESSIIQGPHVSKTNQEIDELKNRILARKSTHRSSRENIANDQKIWHHEQILNHMDSSARLDIQSLQNSFQEDEKENVAHFGNVRQFKCR